jgi:hypothetical protein
MDYKDTKGFVEVNTKKKTNNKSSPTMGSKGVEMQNYFSTLKQVSQE